MTSTGAGSAPSLLTAVQDFAAANSIKLVVPSDPDFNGTAACLIIIPTIKPLAIIRPTSTEDISAIIKFCTSHTVPFVVRGGGHDCAGRSQVDGALTIDLRDMDSSVTVAADRQTARVGCGASLGQVSDALSAQGLVTPVGSNSTVGYIGWATCVGYGMFAKSRGLGVDQVLAAKLVNWEGNVVDATGSANDDLLKGIRGAGPAFGVITELSIKVYPLDKVLSGAIMYDSSDFQATLNAWFDGYQRLAEEGIPDTLGIQLLLVQVPNLGRVVMAWVMWTDADEVKGQQWIDKIASLGTVTLRTVGPNTAGNFMRTNDEAFPSGVYGHNNTISVRGFTPKVRAAIAKFTDNFPTATNGIGSHMITGPSAAPNPHSVFGSRSEHVVLEIFSAIPDPDESKIAASIAWGKAFRRELLENAPEDVVEGAFAALLPADDSDLRMVYGQQNYDFLIELKKKYDPHNIFRNTIPKLV